MLLAVIQSNPVIGKIKKNMENVISIVKEASNKGAELILFPEAALTGYCYESKEEAFDYIPDNLVKMAADAISPICGQSVVLLGLLEKKQNQLYNTASAINSKGIIGCYYKTHLPFLGADKFVTKGDSTAGSLLETPYGKIGILVCYELRFPEVARVLSLKGAELICDLANLPVGGESNVTFIGRTRALENKSFLALCNRCGTERGFNFIGRSQIIDPNGDILASAEDREEILYSEIDLSYARDKVIINDPRQYEMHLYKDRRPDLYGIITERL